MRRALLLLAVVCGSLLVACGGDTPPPTPVVIVVTTTPRPGPTATALPPTATPVPSATPDLAATAAAGKQATAEADRAAEVAAAAATATEQARPTATPVPTDTPEPTATPRPGLGSTIQVGDWSLTLKKTRSRTRLVYDALGRNYEPSGTFWLVYVDAVNHATTSQSSRDTLVWGLLDDHASPYDELWSTSSDKDTDNLAAFVLLEGRSPLFAQITPRATGHFLLLFDVASDAAPETLGVRPFDGDKYSWVFFDLK